MKRAGKLIAPPTSDFYPKTPAIEAQLEEMDTPSLTVPANDRHKGEMFVNEEGKPTIGFCIWCDRDFYSMDEVDAHNADEMAACIGYQHYEAEEEG